MLRIFARLIGLLLLAAGFAALVVDGTRSIAGSQLILTPFQTLLAPKLPMLQQSIAKIHPLLWDPVSVTLLRTPVWVAMAVFGLLFLWAARRRPPGVGYVTRS